MKVFFKFAAVMAAAFVCLQAAGQEMVHNASYPDDPAFNPVADSLKGAIINCQFDNSTIYPQTRRNLKVYVPHGYDASKEACLLVCMDGILFNATTVLDNLIATGEMPLTIGVFVQPGTTYDEEGKVVRYNRSNEFDRTDGTFARFLETEILPYVESLKTPDGLPIRISHNPNDRAITGASSSGIASFTAAWERPDMFARVYSSVGTYVSMRGGNQYPAIIRKTEPKPIRIFLQDGMKDTWNPLFGEWWEQNLLMESALDFAGYEEIAHWDRGGHSVYHGTRMFPDAMRWLWKGWPAPVKAGESRNDMLQSLLGKGKDREAGWQLVEKPSKEVARRLAKPCSEAVYPTGKMVAVAENNSNWILNCVILSDGKRQAQEQFYYLHNPDNSCKGPIALDMAFDTAGNLFVATPYGVQVCDQNGRVRAILTLPSRSIEALAFIGNELYVLSAGKVYVRTLKHTAYDPSTGPIEVKSQGMG